MEPIKKKILNLVKEYYLGSKAPLPSNKVPVSGKVYDEKELQNLVISALEGWWTEGRWCEQFGGRIKEYLGVKFALLVNSGSSANFIALKSLTSVKLGERRIKQGDEIITTAACFPTTINPIIEIGAVPVFVDVELGTYNAKIENIKEAISKRTKAIFLAHTLGNPCDLRKVKELCKRHNLWLIEDNCDALGSKFEGKFTGTFGDLATLSFYPAHQITTAEGGAVLTNSPLIYKIARSIRDWGRDCWCPTGKDGTCGKRYSWQLGKLPKGYDHKYIYSEIGYNLKMTDLQAAIGVAQMEKLDYFINKRCKNFSYLHNLLSEFNRYFILPKASEKSEPSWFGFLLTLKGDKIIREELLKPLNEKGIGTRLLFAGNILKQPYFIDYNVRYRKIGNLPNTEIIMNKSFWIGIYPALGNKHLFYVYSVLKDLLANGGSIWRMKR